MQVSVPTLLVTGGCDEAVTKRNREAQRSLRCEAELQIVSGATHLFEEPRTRWRVAS